MDSSSVSSSGGKKITSQLKSFEGAKLSSFAAMSSCNNNNSELGKSRKSVSSFDMSVADEDTDDRVYCNTEVRSRPGTKPKKPATFALVSEKEMKKRYSVYTGTSMERTTSDDFSNESNTYDNGTFAKRKSDARMKKSNLSGSLDQLALCSKHRDEFHAINNGEKLRLRKEKRNSFSSNRRTRKISSDDYFSPKNQVLSGWQSSSSTDVTAKVTLSKRDDDKRYNEPPSMTAFYVKKV
ncbi:hypothetical protein LSTR_LSTR017457 [Laodelphax striatellus]|uniref:Uncharacterized protein n=1 Tax=Laodelphax striatellus TaxID=195883 RepID=A0A482WZ98_LAOST|nr:hypothetical protein LSTR_LSTR017457 [Laodelphax striatellus]